MVVTAEGMRSYKSGTKHCEEARKTIGADTGWLHVAGSLCHGHLMVKIFDVSLKPIPEPVVRIF